MIYVFTDANKNRIGYVAYNSKGKIIDKGKKDNGDKINSIKRDIIINEGDKMIDLISLNELDSIRYAAKHIKKYILENDKEFDVEFFIDNTNAQKAFSTIISKCCLPPDKDRLDIHSEYVKPIMEKIEKHIDIFDYINAYYCPAHCTDRKEAKRRFKDHNSKETLKEFTNKTKKERKAFIKFLMQGNNAVDEFIKEA